MPAVDSLASSEDEHIPFALDRDPCAFEVGRAVDPLDDEGTCIALDGEQGCLLCSSLASCFPPEAGRS